MRLQIRSTTFALAALAAALPATLSAQSRNEREAFTWSGKISDGHWINVHNLNGTVYVESSSGDKVEVTANRITRRGDPDYVRFEVKKYGSRDEDVVICALWG